MWQELWPAGLARVHYKPGFLCTQRCAAAAMSIPYPESPCNPSATFVHGAAHSRFYQRLHRRYEADLLLLPPVVPRWPSMEQAYDALRARGCDTGTALRVLRQLVMERLIQMDCEGQARCPRTERLQRHRPDLRVRARWRNGGHG